MALQALQRDFQSALLQGSTVLHARVAGTADAGPDRRVAIYAQAYRLRLQEALAEDFSGLAAWLGESGFEALAAAYIARFPSRHPSLRWFGRHMATFLNDTPGWSGQPWLAEMAVFEWAQGEVFDAPDSPATPPDTITAIEPADWPRLRLQPHPSLRRLDLDWNVPALWRALDDGREPPEPAKNPAPQGWLLWRQDLAIHWRSLDSAEAVAVDAWRSGADFAGVCAALCEHMDTTRVATCAAGLLKGWLETGLVAALQTG